MNNNISPVKPLLIMLIKKRWHGFLFFSFIMSCLGIIGIPYEAAVCLDVKMHFLLYETNIWGYLLSAVIWEWSLTGSPVLDNNRLEKHCLGKLASILVETIYVCCGWIMNKYSILLCINASNCGGIVA